jgi:branched-subunit amino acid transport protein
MCILPSLCHQALEFSPVYMIASQQGVQVLFQAMLELFRQQLTHSSQRRRCLSRFIPLRGGPHSLHHRLHLSPLLLEPRTVDRRYLFVQLQRGLPDLAHQFLYFVAIHVVTVLQRLQMLFYALPQPFRQQVDCPP